MFGESQNRRRLTGRETPGQASAGQEEEDLLWFGDCFCREHDSWFDCPHFRPRPSPAQLIACE